MSYNPASRTTRGILADMAAIQRVMGARDVVR